MLLWKYFSYKNHTVEFGVWNTKEVEVSCCRNCLAGIKMKAAMTKFLFLKYCSFLFFSAEELVPLSFKICMWECLWIVKWRISLSFSKLIWLITVIEPRIIIMQIQFYDLFLWLWLSKLSWMLRKHSNC